MVVDPMQLVYTATCEHFAYNILCQLQVPEPKTIDEALTGPHAKKWKNAFESEYQSFMENDTWETWWNFQKAERGSRQ